LSEAIFPNSTISQYTIVSKIGAGGMGEVYRARDARLNREVAIKILPAKLSNDPDRLKRFEQEARATSALNHPNILTIYDIGTHEGSPYIVAELLEGEELRDQLNGAVLPERKALDYAQQITQGLAAAHHRGIVHRDLKPGNLFITTDGRAKILDFGLAKLRPPRNEINSSEIATEKQITDPGTVLGTVGYMSPEQVRGQPVDHRSDIFSFGAILYEMLSGRRAFRRETMAETMTAILKEEPVELTETNAKINPALERIVRRCLEKQPERRFQSGSDLGFAIEALSTPSGSQQVPAALSSEGQSIARGRSLRQWLLIAAAVFLVLALLASLPLAIAHLRESPAETRIIKLSVPAPEKSTFGNLAVSPDGSLLAFTAATSGKVQLWVRALDSLTAQPLPGTEGARYPFWSPDNRWIGFFAGGKLKKVAASGGPVQTLCDAGIAGGGTWSRNGVILFTTLGYGVYRIAASGGDPTLLAALDRSKREWNYNSPSFLPDDRHFLYFIQSGTPGAAGVFVGSIDGSLKQQLLAINTNGIYAASGRNDGGYLLFMREGALLAQPFDVKQLKLTGEPIPVAEHIGTDSTFSQGNFSASLNGVLVYDGSVDRASKQLVWVDRDGKQIRSLGKIGGWSQPALSPNEKRVAVDRDQPGGTREVWLYDAEGGNASRFTFDPADNTTPIWSPDGTQIVWGSNRNVTYDIYEKAANGSGRDEMLYSSNNVKVATDWSRDGRYIVFYELDPKTKRDLWVLPMTGDRKPWPFLATDANEVGAKLSPDGQWLAYASDESDKYEVYVQSFPSGGGKRQISTNGGIGPRWRGDGKELYYDTPDGALMAVDVNLGKGFENGAPHKLFEFRSGNGLITVAPYAASADGQKFLLNMLVDESGGAPLTVVINWTTALKK
jgi:serine/threonine protein kinase